MTFTDRKNIFLTKFLSSVFQFNSIDFDCTKCFLFKYNKEIRFLNLRMVSCCCFDKICLWSVKLSVILHQPRDAIVSLTVLFYLRRFFIVGLVY